MADYQAAQILAELCKADANVAATAPLHTDRLEAAENYRRDRRRVLDLLGINPDDEAAESGAS